LEKEFKSGYDFKKYDEYECHMIGDSAEDLIDYIFVLDSLNFCFWPSNWEYDNLADNLKKLFLNNRQFFKPKNLSTVS
jgi:hypothetical protein